MPTESAGTRFCASAAVALLLLAGCSKPAPPMVDLAIEGVTVIDATTPPRPMQRVLIDDGTIVGVAPMDQPAAPARASVDASGQYVMPGLWDMHVHFLYDERLTDVMADEFLRYGITSVRDTGGDVARLRALRDELRTRQAAPSVYYAGPLLDGRLVVYDGGDPGRPRLGTSVSGPARAPARVAELKESGADLIKIYELVDPETFRALATAARGAGLPIASHVPLTMTADEAGPLVDSMEHLRNIELACASNWQALLAERRARIDGFVEGRGYDLRRELHTLQRLPAIAAYDEARCDEVLARLTETFQVPTLRLNAVAMVAPWNRPDWAGALAGLPDPVRRSWQARAKAMAANNAVADHTFAQWSLFLISRLKASGVPIAAGTDTPIGLGIPGYSLHTELELLVRAGLTPREALYAATLAPAEFFGIDDTLGRIDAGMRADLVLLTADPLEEISNTRKIARVMVGGHWTQTPSTASGDQQEHDLSSVGAGR